jgi:hypothetical protein
MKEEKTLKEMNMGELWALAKSRGISIKGKKKDQLMKELVSHDGTKNEEIKKKSPKVKEENKDFVKVTLEDGSEALVSAASIKSPEKAKKGEKVTIKSVDGRELEVSIGDLRWKGKVIEVPSENAEDVRRILKEGGFYIL